VRVKLIESKRSYGEQLARPHGLKPLLFQHAGQKHPAMCPHDAARLERVSGLLYRLLPRSTACMHLRGHGDLKGAIATMNRALEGLGLTLHPDKTTIGPTARGFDFLGYHHDPTGLRLAMITWRKHQEKLTRLYERYQRQLRAYRKGWIGQSTIPHRQDPARAYLHPRPSIKSHEDITHLLEAYQRRFTAWAQGGLEPCGNLYSGC